MGLARPRCRPREEPVRTIAARERRSVIKLQIRKRMFAEHLVQKDQFGTMADLRRLLLKISERHAPVNITASLSTRRLIVASGSVSTGRKP